MHLSYARDWVLLIGGVFTIIGLLSTLIWGVHKITSKIELIVAVDEDGKNVIDRMKRVEYQVFRNGGESMADSIHRADMTSAKALETAEQAVKEVKEVKETLIWIRDVMMQIVSAPSDTPIVPSPSRENTK